MPLDSLSTLAEAIAAALTVTDGLTGYAYWPDDFGAHAPCVAVIPKRLTYDSDSGGVYPGRSIGYNLIFFAARASDGHEVGMQTLGAYLDDRAAGSIPALLATGDFSFILRGWDDIRLDYALKPDGPQYIGAVGDLEVMQ